MKRCTFGETGLQVSVLGFGGAPIGYLRADRDRVERMLHLMLDAGVNVIDTAASYEGSEELIGQTIGHRRKEYVLISKCGMSIAESVTPAWSAQTITTTIERSLRRLRTDALDVMLLHSCDLETLKKGEALGALVKAQDAGKIKWIGYSGDNEAAAYAVELDEVAVIQTSVNVCDQANIDAVLPVAMKNNVGVMAKRPIANAAWKDLKQQPGLYQDYARTYTDRLRAMKITPEELGCHGKPEEVWPQLALRFTLSQPGVHTAIIGTTNPDNAKANIAAAAMPPLPVETIQKIRTAFRRAEAESGTKWLGQT